MLQYLMGIDDIGNRVGTERLLIDQPIYNTAMAQMDGATSMIVCFVFFEEDYPVEAHYEPWAFTVGESGVVRSGSLFSQYDEDSPLKIDVTALSATSVKVAEQYMSTTGVFPFRTENVLDDGQEGTWTKCSSSTVSNLSIRALSSSSAVALYVDSIYGYLYARTVASSSSLGAVVAVELIGVGSSIGLSALSVTKAVACYKTGRTSGDLYARVLDVTGETITAGASPYLVAEAGSYPSVVTLTSSTALVVYQLSGHIMANVLTVSGDTISVGPSFTVESSASNLYPKAASLSATAAIVAYQSGNYGCARTIAIDGTDISSGDIVRLDAGIVTHISISKVSETQAMVAYCKNGSAGYMRMIAA